ncbi:MAG TPA: CNNM domain-containing protein [Usitatibacteraceae bacterium]|nr:CNNM domain-containing protein [Usitatibacteraceae bacterium]
MTDDISLHWLFWLLATLLLCSGFFSMSETCMMSLNRYRLRHLIKQGSRGARYAGALLDKTEEMLSFILAGNTVLNAATTILVAEICRRLFGEGEYVLAIATTAASFAILVFAEILPKVLGARFSERIALVASYVLYALVNFVLIRIVMWFINALVKTILAALRLKPAVEGAQPLSMEEMRTLVLEGGQFIPKKHQNIMVNLFDLENMTVDDTMTPRALIEGIDIEEKIEEIRNKLATAHHTRLVVYQGDLSNVIGHVHVRRVLNASRREPLDRETLRGIIREPYFVPEGTPLLQQLTQFQENQRRMALVVDEYGEILGLVTMQDILEEIVGEFTSQSPMNIGHFRKQDDGSVIVEGSCPLRILNRKLGYGFPLDGPKTINGLLLEELRDIPQPGVSIQIAGYPVEILQVQDTMVKSVRLPARTVA